MGQWSFLADTLNICMGPVGIAGLLEVYPVILSLVFWESLLVTVVHLDFYVGVHFEEFIKIRNIH